MSYRTSTGDSSSSRHYASTSPLSSNRTLTIDDNDDDENEAFLSFSSPTVGITETESATYQRSDNGRRGSSHLRDNHQSEITVLAHGHDALPDYPSAGSSSSSHHWLGESSSSSSGGTSLSTAAALASTGLDPKTATTPPYSKWSTIGHQISFLGTGIFSTIAVQWLYYQGAASGTSMLTVFFNYIGMICVGFIFAYQSWQADRKQRKLAISATSGASSHVEYDVLLTEVNEPKDINGQPVSRRKHVDEEESDDEDVEDDFEHMDNHDEEKLKLTTNKAKMGRSSSSLPRSSSAVLKATETNAHWARLHWPVIQVAVMDVIANALITVGFFYVGSGMYQVIYSSIVIWCAILTRIFLSRKLNNIQWVAIVGVTVGLAVSAVGTVQDVSPDGPVQTWLEKSFGALLTLGATFLYACVYVLSDKVLSTFKPKPIPEKVCSMVGSYASLLTFLYLCVHTFPNWQTEVVDLVKAHNGQWFGILCVYPLLTISSMLHSLNYYVLLSRINNIAVGILQSLRAVLVFVMSHYMYCGISSTQCFNKWKFLSAVIVIGCVTLFSFNTPTKPSPSEAETQGLESGRHVRAARAVSRPGSPSSS